MQDAFFVGIANHGHHQAIGRVCCKANVPIVFVDDGIAIQRAVELWVFFQGGHASLDQESQHGDLHARLFVFLVGRHTKGFQLSDIGIIVVGDSGNHDGVAQQIGAADFFDASHFFALNGTKFGEINFGPRNQAQCSTIATCGGFVRLSFGLRSTCHHGFGKGLYVLL